MSRSPPLRGRSYRDNSSPGECDKLPDLTFDPATETLYARGLKYPNFVDSDAAILMQISQTTEQWPLFHHESALLNPKMFPV
ncbi:MAG: hypothetical protein WD000_04300 [Thermodesulfobacteriota bacterium]